MRRALPGFVAVWALGILAADFGVAWMDAGALRTALRLALGAVLALGVACRGRARWTAALALGALLGAQSLADRAVEAQWSPAEPRVEAVVEARVRRVAHAGESLRIDLDSVQTVRRDVRLPPRLRLYVRLPAERFGTLLPGDRVRTRLRVRRPVGRRNPGSGDPALRLRRAGIGGLAAPVHRSLVVRIDASGVVADARRAFHRVRHREIERLRGAGAGLAAALALGDRSGLSDPEQEALRALGLAHLLAVSGLHVALVGALAFAGARAALLAVGTARLRADPRRHAWLAAATVAVAYGALAGWGVPVQRALLFGAALGAGFVARRPVGRAAPLALACACVLVADPGALFDPGAQLSFAAAAALRFGIRPEAGSGGSDSGAHRAFEVSVLALAATLPLAAWHFGRAAPIGLATNLLAVPLTGAVLLPASLVVVGTSLVGVGAALVEPATRVFAELSAGGLGGLERLAAAVPASFSRPAAVTPGIAVATGCALAAVRARRLRVRLALVGLASAALAALPPLALLPPSPRVLALDVGQGDAALVQSDGVAILVDAGGPGRGRAVILPALRAAGVRALDLVVLTHADLDHRGGLPEVSRGIPIRRIWVPRGAAGQSGFAGPEGVALVERGAGDASLRLGALRVTPLWPPACAGASCESESRNDRSLVVRVDAPGGRVLFPGDLERVGERALVASGADLRADVLLLPHHGSRTSSTAQFLEAVSPQVTVASAPCLGRFEMPAPAVVARVRARGAALFWTGRDGAFGATLAPGAPIRAWRSASLDFCGAPRARRGTRD